jgi:hypothetical protein
MDPDFAPIGARTGPAGGTTLASGIVMQTYENGCVLVNPVANKGKQLKSVVGSSIRRTSNVVTLVCSTLTGLAAGDKIRIPECEDSSFVGTFTLLTASGGTYTWSQTGADVALISRPYCFAQVKSTVDLTGEGYVRILGTDDSHDDYDNGTSQNDGSAVGVATLWSGDGVLFIKPSTIE